MNLKRYGRQSILFPGKPKLICSSSIAGDIEGKGPIGKHFDVVLTDDTWGEKSWEKAERKMYEQAVRIACEKLKKNPEELDCLLGGDLLNQLISANFAARALKTPYLGLYGACSTMAESILVGSILVDGEFASSVACCASSHFSTAERQYRFPLELGGQSTPTSQRTVTGAGCAIVMATEAANAYSGLFGNPETGIYGKISVTGGAIGRVIDLGVTDANNMGAAMAPAAADTLNALLTDTNQTVDDFDLIITGDLGRLGSQLFADLCRNKKIDLGSKHLDCGNIVFSEGQNVDCGGSGCGCCAVTLCGYLLKRMEAGDFSRAILMATGALMSPDTSLQGDTIPSIAHAIILERNGQ